MEFMEVLPQNQVHLAVFMDLCYLFILILKEQTWKKNSIEASDNVTTSTYPVAEAEYSYWDFGWQIGLNYWLLWQ